MLDQAPLLRRALTLNACFSLLSGLLLVLLREPLAAWMGVAAPRTLLVLGVVLLAFAGHLFWASRRRIPALEAFYFVISDAIWVLGSAVLVIGFPSALSTPGRVLAVAVAVIVALFTVLQAKGVRSQDKNRLMRHDALRTATRFRRMWRFLS